MSHCTEDYIEWKITGLIHTSGAQLGEPQKKSKNLSQNEVVRSKGSVMYRNKPRSKKTSCDIKVYTDRQTASFMELSHSSKVSCRAVTQELRSILWNPKVHYRVHNSPPLIPIHNIASYRSKVYFNTSIIHLCPGLPSGLFPSGFPTNSLHVFLSAPICATCPAHFILSSFWLHLAKSTIYEAPHYADFEI
jgi:hypothetical protein